MVSCGRWCTIDFCNRSSQLRNQRDSHSVGLLYGVSIFLSDFDLSRIRFCLKMNAGILVQKYRNFIKIK